MQRTIFTTPVIRALFRGLSRGVLRLAGWQVLGSLAPQTQRSVIIGAPHTSNWDLPCMLMVAFVLGLNVRWMGKASIFRFPFGGLMRWLGGVAVDRSKPNNLVALSAQTLREAAQPLQLLVPPEGTRSKVRHWKTGFYYIAQSAQVPVVLAYLDFATKTCGLGPVLYPSGDLEADLARIKAFYAPFKGKNPELFEVA